MRGVSPMFCIGGRGVGPISGKNGYESIITVRNKVAKHPPPGRSTHIPPRGRRLPLRTVRILLECILVYGEIAFTSAR